jgi:electron transport complex protein RnfC
MLRTFRIGGIHPPENKLSAGKKITALATPKQVIIPLSQHIGAPAQAVVKKGDLVKVGTLIAKAGGFVSANIHSSVSGKVNKIDNALDASLYALISPPVPRRVPPKYRTTITSRFSFPDASI